MRKVLQFTFLFILLVLSTQSTINAQTTLNLGDIAFIDYNADGTDRFGFVCLVDISASTVITFNENGWFNSGGFRSGENSIIVTLTSTLEPGDQVYVSASGSVQNQIGTSIGNYTGSALALSGSGDQIFAYQGSAPANNSAGELSKFVAAIQMNCSNCSTNNWDGEATSSTTSAKPSVFIASGPGTNTTYFGSETDNAQYNCFTFSGSSSSVATVIYDASNWNTSNAASFAVNNCSFALPVKLTSFNVNSKDNSNLLSWTTANEINNEKFEIERSINGKLFENIGSVRGQGNSYQNVDYTFEDTKPNFGANYYRLKQVDFDGKYEYSDIIRADNTKSRINIYPTSTSNYITIDMDEEQVASVVVFNEIGQTIKDMTISEMKTRIDISDLPNGMYFVQVNAQSGKEIKRIIKQ